MFTKQAAPAPKPAKKSPAVEAPPTAKLRRAARVAALRKKPAAPAVEPDGDEGAGY